MPYQSNLIPDFWTSYRQRRATGGRPLTSREMRGFLDPLLGYASQREESAADRAQRQANVSRAMDMQQQQINDANQAAQVSGAADILGLGLAYKLGSQRNSLLGGLLGRGAAGAGASAPIAGGAGNIGGAFATGGALAPTASPFTGVGPLASFAGSGTETAGSLAGGGLASSAGTGILGAGLGYGASKLLGANQDISQALSLGGAGAGIGFAVGGPVGAAVGGAIGVGASLLDDVGGFFGGLF